MSKAIEAQHASRCSDCGGAIREGDRIVRDEEREGVRWMHERCPGAQFVLDLKPHETVCLTCFTVKPCVCDDGL